MKILARAMKTLVPMVLLAACGGGGGGGASAAYELRGTPRSFERDDGTVTSQLDLLTMKYTARRSILISNDDAGASRARVHLTSDQGAIFVGGAVTGGGGPQRYIFTITLTATADSDAQAREAIDTIVVSHRDATEPGVFYLDTDVSFQKYEASGVTRAAELAAGLPPDLSYELYEYSDSGSLGSSIVHGTGATLESGSGAIEFNGTFDAASLSSGAGSINVSGEIASLDARTGSGAITAEVYGARATQANLAANAGNVTVTVNRAPSGVYDLDARSVTGSATISVSGTSPVGTQSSTHAHVQSPGYADGNPKIVVNGSATAGNVTIQD